MSALFGEVVTAMVTPFADDLSLDVDGAVALAKHLAEHGSDGIVLAGTTGESPTLTSDETAALVEAVAAAVAVPVEGRHHGGEHGPQRGPHARAASVERSRPSVASRSSCSSNQTVWYDSMTGLVNQSCSPAATRRSASAKRGS